jgi:hypothetical protein
LLDREFKKFLVKLPTTVSTYASELNGRLSMTVSQVGKSVENNYWLHYSLFRDSFGMKLNYSINLGTDSQRENIRIVKRIPKSSFKPKDPAFSFTFEKDTAVTSESKPEVLEISRPETKLDLVSEFEQIDQGRPSSQVMEAIGDNISDIRIVSDLDFRKATATGSPRLENLITPPLQDLVDLKIHDLAGFIQEQLGDKTIEKEYQVADTEI